MEEKNRKYFTKKNILLLSIIIVCMGLIFYIALNMIFPNHDLTKIEQGAAQNVVEDFIGDLYVKEELKVEDYMIEGWTLEEAKNLFLGSNQIESLKIESIKNDSYSQYIERYTKNRQKKGIELQGDKYTSFTVEINHNYKDDSGYEDVVKTMVVLLEKKEGSWRIITLGTSSIIDSLI